MTNAYPLSSQGQAVSEALKTQLQQSSQLQGLWLAFEMAPRRDGHVGTDVTRGPQSPLGILPDYLRGKVAQAVKATLGTLKPSVGWPIPATGLWKLRGRHGYASM